MTNEAQEVKGAPSPHAKNLSGDNLAGQGGEEIVGYPPAPNSSSVKRPGGEVALPPPAGRGSRTRPHPGAAGSRSPSSGPHLSPLAPGRARATPGAPEKPRKTRGRCSPSGPALRPRPRPLGAPHPSGSPRLF